MGFQKEQRPSIRKPGGRNLGVFESTAASTALDPKGFIPLVTAVTSSGAPVVYTLGRAPKIGDEFTLYASLITSSSIAPFHVNAGSGVSIGSSSEDMVTLAITGDAITLGGISATRWATVGSHGAVFSTST